MRRDQLHQRIIERLERLPPPFQAHDGVVPVPPPLPIDRAERAALFASIDRGIADARAGRTIPWEEVDRLTRQKLGLPPA